MKKVLGMFAAVAVAVMPLAAQATSLAGHGSDYTRGPQERINGNFYVGGGTVSLASDTEGDLVAAGGNISVTGRVGQDAAVAGGNIQLLGPVGGDVRAMGGTVTVGDRVGGDVLALGGTVHILSAANVQGDLWVAGGHVIIDGVVQGSVHMSGGSLIINGTVGGDVRARVDQLSLGQDSQIRGALWYRSPQMAAVAPTAHINGTTTYEPVVRIGTQSGSGAKGATWAAGMAVVAMMTAMKTIALLGAAALLVWRWRRWSLAMIQQAADSFWPSVGKGLVYGILVPLGAGLLLVSFIGTLAGVVALLTYGIVAIVAKVLSGIFLGAWVSKMIGKRQVLHVTWVNALGGMILLQVLVIVPVLGWLAEVVLMLAVFGVLAQSVQRQLALK